MNKIVVREGKKEDLSDVLELIKELADYERAPEQVINTVAQMEADGFGPRPLYGMYVAEYVNKIVGVAIYYYRYSTWKGKRLYLEDIIVTAQQRGQGIGKALFERTMQRALDDHCSGMTWQVLDWNEPAIHFYKKYGCTFDAEWINCSLEKSNIDSIIKNDPA